MIGDNLTSLFLTNPAAAQAIRRQKLGMDLAAAGTSGEPIRAHTQGLNRMAQALLGVLALNKSDDEFKSMKADADRGLADWQATTAQLMGGGGQQPAPMPQTPQPSPTGGGVFQNIPPAPVGIHMAEAGGSMAPNIYGDGGRAAGPMQVHAGALADVNRANGTNYTHQQLAAQPEVGKQVGDAYYQQMLQQFGDPAKAAAAYNAGPGRVAAAVAQYGDGWMQGIPDTTKAYVAKVMGAGEQQQPQAAPQGPSPTDAALAQARQLAAVATQAANHPDPRIRAQAPMLMQRAGQMESRALAEQTRQEARAEKVPQTITMQDPDGKGVGIYERTPTGTGMRIGAAPKQPGESSGPFAGTGMEQQAANTLLQIGPLVANGTATQEQRNQYALAYGHIEQGKVSMVPDPTDPSGQRQVMARIPGVVPPQFPRPDGGQPAPGPVQAGAQPQAASGAPGALVLIPGTTKPAPPLTEAQGRIATFADRIAATLPIIEANQGAGLSYTQNAMRNVPVVGNALISNEMQQLDQAQRNFINAVLRRESGAVISPEEFDNAKKQYFPVPGDKPDVLAQKKKNRQDVLEGFAREGGPTYKIPEQKGTSPADKLPPGFKVIQ